MARLSRPGLRKKNIHDNRDEALRSMPLASERDRCGDGLLGAAKKSPLFGKLGRLVECFWWLCLIVVGFSLSINAFFLLTEKSGTNISRKSIEECYSYCENTLGKMWLAKDGETLVCNCDNGQSKTMQNYLYE